MTIVKLCRMQPTPIIVAYSAGFLIFKVPCALHSVLLERLCPP